LLLIMAIIEPEVESSVVYDKNEYTISGGDVTAFLPEESDVYNVTLVGINCKAIITNDARSIIMQGTVNYNTKETTAQQLTIDADTATIDEVYFGIGGQKLILPSNGNYNLAMVTGNGEITIGNNCEASIGDIKSERLDINATGNCSVLRISGKGAFVNLSGRFSFVYASFATVTILDNAVYCTVIGNNNEILCNEKSAFSTILGNDNRVTDLGIGNKTGVEPVSGGKLADGKFGDITITDNKIKSNTDTIILDNSTTISGSAEVAGSMSVSGSVAIGGTVTIAGNTISGTNTGDQTITLTGDVTGSGTTGVFASINNNAVITKTLTNFANTTGTVTSADTIISALQKINGNAALLIGGSGVTNQIPFFSATRTIGGATTFTYATGTGLTIGNNTASNSTSSGALVVTGGVGIGGNAFIGGNLTVSGTISGTVTVTLSGDVTGAANNTTIANSTIMGKTLGSFTSGAGTITGSDTLLSALQKLNGNDALAIRGSGTSGQVPFLNGAQSVTGASTFTYASGTGLTIGNNTASNGVNSGALVVTGGVGIGGSAFIGGNLTVTGTISGTVTATLAGDVTGAANNNTIANTIIMGKTLGSFASTTGTITSSDTLLNALQKLNGNTALAVSGSGTSGHVPFLNGTKTITSAGTLTYSTGSGLTIGNNTSSANTTSGALVVTGGAGIGGSVFIGGSVTVSGTLNATIAGDVTGNINNTTIANSTIMGKTLGSFSSTTGTITGSDTLLSALQKLNGNQAIAIGGSGRTNGFAYFTNSNTLATTTNVVLNGDKIEANGVVTNTIDGGANNDISLITTGNNRVALSGNPLNNNHAATKVYVDTIFSQWTKVKPADSSIISNNVAQTDSDFSGVPVQVGTFKISGYFHLFSTSSTPDIKITLNTTSAVTVSFLSLRYSKRSGVTASIENSSQVTLGTTVAHNIGANGTGEVLEVSGYIIVTAVPTAGTTYIIQWAQNASNPTASTIRRGSHVSIMRIA
jgi:hypothetical protein